MTMKKKLLLLTFSLRQADYRRRSSIRLFLLRTLFASRHRPSEFSELGGNYWNIYSQSERERGFKLIGTERNNHSSASRIDRFHFLRSNRCRSWHRVMASRAWMIHRPYLRLLLLTLLNSWWPTSQATAKAWVERVQSKSLRALFAALFSMLFLFLSINK
jgi:hypothetical protein